MLTMDRIKYIRREVINKGRSINSVAKEKGHAWETVNKYVECQDFNIKKTKKTRESRLDKFKPTIDKWLEDDLNAPRKQRHTAKRIHERLQKVFKNDYDMSDRTIRSYVAKRKAELQREIVDCYLPLEHAPGEAQVDFGKVTFVENGITYEGSELVLSYPNSNGALVQLCKGENLECLLTALKSMFEFTGTVPKEIWFDNMSTAVKKIKKSHERDLTERFERFALHYGFEHNFCNPSKGNEKGHVENKVGYSRRNLFVPVPEFRELKEYNKDLLQECLEDMDRDHYVKKAKISYLFEKDIAASRPLPVVPFETSKLVKLKADKYGKIRLDGKYTYSTSPAYCQQQVWAKVTDLEVIILNNDYKEVVRHNRLYGDQLDSMQWITYIDLMSRKPFALKYTSFYSSIPDEMRCYFDTCNLEERKQGLKALNLMLQNISIEEAANVFSSAIEANCRDSDSLIGLYHRVVNGVLEMPDMELPDFVPQLKGYTTDLDVYDGLMGGGSK
ncbi:IS21 family transposase [Alkalicella caledoniensis]|uniref:IS21 family transposase n=1 Tax=Alkalicella caledoniensis TaxID=2731377 RepID=A0A7G9W8N8_ALKCA|nr:IS21 family transposase [Alkalicella caledoniensis]QNO13394.1 IS21 family transposase [Alkalicella caledoniensis]QNO15050.1 IS21 family transposase [Alkalicella caledoniensis]